MIERRETNRHKAFSPRSMVAGVLTLFVILQGLTAIGSSVPRFARGGSETSFVVSLFGVTCTVNAQDGDHSPAHEHGSAQCCVLCGARDFDGAALPAVTQPTEAPAPPSALDAKEAPSSETRGDPPLGWASSWSSQAPPYFS
jgi:hypothetical protein